MRRVIALAAVLLLVFAVSGCGGSGGGEVSPSAEQTQKENTADERDVSQNTGERENGTEGQTMRISIKSEDYEILYELNDSTAAKELFAQLPLTVEVEPFSDNEMTFYPEKLSTEDTPLSGGETGSLSYYEPWGDVVMFYAPCEPNNSLFELGTAVSGRENIQKLSGTITVSPYE